MTIAQMNKQGMTRDDVDKTVASCICAVCEAELTQVADRSTDPLTWVVACSRDKAHEGYEPIQGAIELATVYGGGPAYLNQAIAKRSPLFAGASDRVMIQRLTDQYGLSRIQAAAGLLHAKGLGLDPWLHQIAFLTFNSDAGKKLQVMITEKGWAFLANTHEPDEFMGMPAVKPMTPEEKIAWGWAEDDVAYWASSKKRSWDTETRVARRVSAKEIQNGKAGSQWTPLADDPHHHCRVRVVRTWYEENYPALATIVEDTAPEDSEIAIVIEGTFQEVPAESQSVSALSADVPMSEWETRCPDHGDEWKEGRFGPFHGLPRNGGFCNQNKVINDRLKPLLEQASAALNQSKADIAAFLRERFDDTWSKLAVPDKISAVQELQAAAEAKETDEDVAEPSVDADGAVAGGERESGMKDWSDLLIACKGNFDKGAAELLEALGKTDSSEVTDYEAAYAEVSEKWG